MTDASTTTATTSGTAASLAETRVLVVRPDDTARAVIERLRADPTLVRSVVAVTSGEGNPAVVDAGRLLAAAPGTPMTALADGDVPAVPPGADQEVVAHLAGSDGGCGVVAVVSPDGRLVGLVLPETVIGVLRHEHTEDLARLGGFLHDTATARLAAAEMVRRRLWHRLPWLLVGLAAAMVAAGIMRAFEAELSANLAIAFFLPGVVYLADAVGTQTETVVIRGLSVGVPIRQVVVREILTGLAIGAALAVAVLPVVWAWQGAAIAATVAVAIFAASSVATTVAMALPTVLSRRGVDPAFGSGPLATVVQDLLSILIYLGAAQLILG